MLTNRTPLRLSTTRRLTQAVAYLILVLGTLAIGFPILWAVVSSLKTNNEIFITPMEWIPRAFHFENYIKPFTQTNFAVYFGNSILAAVVTVLLSILVASLAGFSLAKYNYFGKNVAFLAILATMMLPVQVILIPLYLVVKDFGWLDSYQGLILPQAITALSIFLMRQHIVTIPDDYIDAARIDGSSELNILAQVILPMSRPVLSAVTVFSFLGSWDSFLWPMVVVTKSSLRTIPLGISLFFTEYSTQYNQALAVAIMVMLPVLILYIILQNQFVEGMTRSGLK
jgi:ABC-type glycerol-3-phosphate transport system permease component